MATSAGIIIFCLVALSSACVLSRPTVADHNRTPPATPALLPATAAVVRQGSFFSGQEALKEETLFYQALQQFFDPTPGEPRAAQARLENFLNAYPQGKWHDAAQGMINLITERDDCRLHLAAAAEKAALVTAERNKARQENEQLHLLHEKYQAEAAVCQQENAQLKKDMELLKNLEIQLNTREKELR